MVRLNPYLRQNYSIYMRNFKQNQHKLSNNHVQFSNRNLLCKFEPPSRKSWIRPCFYHLFYFIYMGKPIWDPYETGCTAHMGPIWVPIWDPYRLLAGYKPYGLNPANMPLWVPYGLPICGLPRWVPYNSPIKKQEMSQSRDECPQRNWSSIRHI